MMTSLLSRLSPIPSFPSYTGPYNVGTADIEIPASELSSPAPAPDGSIATVSFRVFYPCETSKHSYLAYWIPDPQRDYVDGYARFLGISERISGFIAYLPRLLYHISLPASQNAEVLKSRTMIKRWPVMVFSHGLGGSRNAYSHILGSLASHGVVIFAPEHRDGSAPISFIKQTKNCKARSVNYRSMPHTPSREVEDARNEQLRIRLWEMGLVFQAIVKMDKGEILTNLAIPAKTSVDTSQGGILAMFRDALDVHTPGSITWSGHSFGAATIIQFIKSVFYRPPPTPSTSYQPLYRPSEDSKLVSQVTPKTPIALLDLWTLPLRSDATRWLWDQPLPAYTNGGAGGLSILAILSEAFFKWKGNLVQTKRALSVDPSQDEASASTSQAPFIFYPNSSAHLSQSDFGVLFPWFTKKVLKADEPERTLRLNARAVLELMRRNDIEVADTSDIDLELGVGRGKHHHHKAAEAQHQKNFTNSDADHRNKSRANPQLGGDASKIEGRMFGQDHDILTSDGSVRGWTAVFLEEGKRADSQMNEKVELTRAPRDVINIEAVQQASQQETVSA